MKSYKGLQSCCKVKERLSTKPSSVSINSSWAIANHNVIVRYSIPPGMLFFLHMSHVTSTATSRPHCAKLNTRLRIPLTTMNFARCSLLFNAKPHTRPEPSFRDARYPTDSFLKGPAYSFHWQDLQCRGRLQHRDCLPLPSCCHGR